MGKHRKFQYSRVTPELVVRLREVFEKHPDMGAAEIESITGWVSRSTINKVRAGDYDHLVESEILPVWGGGCSKSDSDLIDHMRTLHDENMAESKLQTEILKSINRLLADISLMLVNGIESPDHQKSKANVAHFRGRVIKNRVEDEE